MEPLQSIISQIDSLVWGPVMLVLLMGTGLFLSIRTRFLGPRNLFFALKTSLGKEARQSGSGPGDISSFSALTTALAATIGTGNIVGVATAMVSGGPGALVWMWLSALLGMTSKFSECMLAVKYREVNESGEMSGGPMYTMKKAFRHKRLGAVLGWLFALFAVTASFGIGNMTQANSISSSLPRHLWNTCMDPRSDPDTSRPVYFTGRHQKYFKGFPDCGSFYGCFLYSSRPAGYFYKLPQSPRWTFHDLSYGLQSPCGRRRALWQHHCFHDKRPPLRRGKRCIFQ